MKCISGILPLILLFLAAACSPPEDDELVSEERLAYEATVLGTAEMSGAAIYASVAEEVGLDEELTSRGPFTLFVPSDDVLNGLEEGTLQRLRSDRDALRAIAEYHLLEGRMLSAEMVGEMSIATMHGEAMTIAATDEAITVTDATGNTVLVTVADLETENGVVHMIDGLLLPAEIDDLVDDEFSGEDVVYDDEPIAE